MTSYRTPPPQQRAADWSDGETSVLIGAWGPTHQRRGRLALKDWRAVASAVNAHGRAAGHRYNRTRAQCQSRVGSLKRRYKMELLSAASSTWRHLPRLRAFLADPADGPPPGFPAAKTTLAPVKEEKVETSEVGEEEEEVGGGEKGLAGTCCWTVPRKLGNGGAAGDAGLCPAAVVTKLAEVYERVELARLNSEKVKMEVEAEKAMFDAVKMEY
ncbi:hypothetical protein QOZ80_3AG0244440 [Eleusine coracana subsp. coracana]|nr:hypothetical protein QOZ80_3AG0244440 [Eleusine coracana subsp. coracana]